MDVNIIMRHTGELFIQTPESEHPLNIRVELKTDSKQETLDKLYVIVALEHELEEVVLDYFDTSFDQLLNIKAAPDHKAYAMNLMRYQLLEHISQMIRYGVTDQLAGRNISSFTLIDLNPYED
jgi:hypothetical protein